MTIKELNCKMYGLLRTGEVIALREMLRNCCEYAMSYSISAYQTERDYSISTLDDRIHDMELKGKLTVAERRHWLDEVFEVEVELHTILDSRTNHCQNDYYVTNIIYDYLNAKGFKIEI